jgi:hypothetical protein
MKLLARFKKLPILFAPWDCVVEPTTTTGAPQLKTPKSRTDPQVVGHLMQCYKPFNMDYQAVSEPSEQPPFKVTRSHSPTFTTGTTHACLGTQLPECDLMVVQSVQRRYQHLHYSHIRLLARFKELPILFDPCWNQLLLSGHMPAWVLVPDCDLAARLGACFSSRNRSGMPIGTI